MGKTSNKRMFFWMQEPKADKDEELCKKVNENLNNPPAPGSARAGGGSGAGLPGGLPAGLDFNNLGDSELQNLLNNMSQQQLMQLLEAHWVVAMPLVLPACWVGLGGQECDR